MGHAQGKHSERNKQAYAHALVVEGGAMRGIFSTGVLDGFLGAGFNPFDLLLGVSSGATNLASYLAQMPQRNFKIYTEYALQKEFISIKRFLLGGHLMDLDWMWERTIAEIRLDLKRIFAQEKLFLVGLTDVHSGQAIYKQTDEHDLEDVIKASSAMPVVYRSFPLIDGVPTVDGGMADPIPVQKAIAMGARKIMVIRSRPRHYVKKEMISNKLLLWKLRSYPALKRVVNERVGKYNQAVALIHQPPQGVTMIEINPPRHFRPARFGRDKRSLMEGYAQGLKMASVAMRSWQGDAS